MDFRKIIKFLFTAGLIFVVAYFGIKIIFPAPDRLDAYNNTYNLLSSQDYEQTMESTQNLIGLMQDKIDANQTGVNQELQNKLIITTNIIQASQNANELMLLQFAFAENNPTYNTEVRALNGVYEEMTQTFADLKAYTQSYVDPFIESAEEHDVSTMNSYANAVYNINIKLTDYFTEYTTRMVTTFETLDKDYTNNPLSRKMLNLTSIWVEYADNQLKNEEANIVELLDNSGYLKDFTASKMNLAFANSYYTATTSQNQLLTNIEHAENEKVVSILASSEEQTYIDSLTDEQIKQANTNLLALLKGAA